MPTKAVPLADMPPLDERRPDEMLTTAEVAGYLGVEPSTLDKWRSLRQRGLLAGAGPAYTRLGPGRRARVRYYVRDIKTYLAEHAYPG
jgi:transposase-like protein